MEILIVLRGSMTGWEWSVTHKQMNLIFVRDQESASASSRDKWSDQPLAPVTSQAAITLHKQSTGGIRMILKSCVIFAFYLSSGLSLVISSPLSEEFEKQFYSTMLSDVIGEGADVMCWLLIQKQCASLKTSLPIIAVTYLMTSEKCFRPGRRSGEGEGGNTDGGEVIPGPWLPCQLSHWGHGGRGVQGRCGG